MRPFKKKKRHLRRIFCSNLNPHFVSYPDFADFSLFLLNRVELIECAVDGASDGVLVRDLGLLFLSGTQYSIPVLKLTVNVLKEAATRVLISNK